MDRTVTTFISLASSAVNQTLPSEDVLKNADFEELYQLAVSHQMTAIIGDALNSAGISNGKFARERIKSITMALQYDVEREQIQNELERAEIWYLPLKGVIMQGYYPKTGLRQMCDNDILFDPSRADDVRKIMESCGYETIRFGKLHQDDYQKGPFLHFEMHRRLFSALSDDKVCSYYKNAERILKGSGWQKHLTNEDFYIYMIAHEYRHYEWEGTGLRPLLDTYVFLKKFEEVLDWKYINAEFRKMGTADFEKANRNLCFKVFSEGRTDTLTESEQEFLLSLVSFGAYGTKEHKIENQVAKHGVLRYIFHRTFLSMSEIEQIYPFFYKNKVFLPVLPLVRLFRRRKNAKKEIGALLDLTGKRK